MAIDISRDEVDAAYYGTVTDDEWARIQGLLRRAERELTILVGPLGQYDPQLVEDTLIDAVLESGGIDNPQRFRSESDGDYSYTRMTLASGVLSRFWWPYNLFALFGVAVPTVGTIRVRIPCERAARY